MTAGDVVEHLAAVRDRIAGAGGDVEQVTVVAVTKDLSVDAVRSSWQNIAMSR